MPTRRQSSPLAAKAAFQSRHYLLMAEALGRALVRASEEDQVDTVRDVIWCVLEAFRKDRVDFDEEPFMAELRACERRIRKAYWP